MNVTNNFNADRPVPPKLTGAEAVRLTYRTLNPTDIQLLNDFKTKAAEFYDWVDAIGNSRELSLAKTAIQEAVFWTTNHITK